MRQIRSYLKCDWNYLYYNRRTRKGSGSRRLWESPPVPSERYERGPCLCVFVARFDRQIFYYSSKRIRGGSTYAECNSGQCDPAIVSLPRLARPGDTIDSVQLLARHHTQAEAGRQAGREARKERGSGSGNGGREGKLKTPAGHDIVC